MCTCPHFQGLEDTEKAAAIEEIQSQMRRTLALRAPEVYGYIHTDMTASPELLNGLHGERMGMWAEHLGTLVGTTIREYFQTNVAQLVDGGRQCF